MPHLGMGELVIVVILCGVAALFFSMIQARLGARAPSSRLWRGPSLRRRDPLDDRALLAVAAAMPLTPIGEVDEGEWVRILGAVEGPASESEVRSPLTGASGVARHMIVEYAATEGPASVAEERRAVDFVIDDGTGRARIAVPRARFVLSLRPIEPPIVRVDAWLAGRGGEGVVIAASREAVLGFGGVVTVVGRARWEDDPDLEPRDPDATYRSSVRARRLVLESTRDRAMVVSDSERLMPGAGGPTEPPPTRPRGATASRSPTPGLRLRLTVGLTIASAVAGAVVVVMRPPAGPHADFLAASPVEDTGDAGAAPPDASGDVASVEIDVIRVSEEEGTIDERLGDLSALRLAPFDVYRSMTLISHAALETEIGRPFDVTLPNGRAVRMAIDDVAADGRVRAWIDVDRSALPTILSQRPVDAVLREPFFLTGQRDDAGPLVIRVTVTAAPVAPGPLEVGALAPELVGHLRDGVSVDLVDLRGHVVVVDFWASWCEPCADALPFLQRLHASRSDAGLRVIGVAIDSSAARVDAYAARFGVTFPTVHDREGSRLAGAWSVMTMPTLVIVGCDGIVQHVHEGFRVGDPAELEPLVDRAMASCSE